MSILDFFRSKKQNSSASIAKERLQIIVAHERGQRSQPDYLPQLQKDLLDVIRKYIPIDQEQIQVELANQGNCSVLELNITLPDPDSDGR
ncbi:cell division topological specificity factor MinE [Gammaproteobacteria bacterium ESL0073]|uniref:Cell division topological specificity factor n=1 Tax=Entomomonas moraniae TaxID=2213226 RepID=A0A3Q9JJ27_9GAMM|nr:cell division topological specificity factor MinE [Entomomonas moraniae]AWM79572.1 cell division topological specificity factor MinE [Gammaproteobacteria bacterium ESL0073]AZS50803.1 cell division topological specificity factor MinE [Entomomonas moraniae]